MKCDVIECGEDAEDCLSIPMQRARTGTATPLCRHHLEFAGLILIGFGVPMQEIRVEPIPMNESIKTGCVCGGMGRCGECMIR